MVQSYSFVGENTPESLSIVQFEALSKPLTPIALRWNMSKFENILGRKFCIENILVTFFFAINMLKSLFCEDISVKYEFKSEKFKGGVDRVKFK